MDEKDFAEFEQSLLEGLDWAKKNKERIKQKKLEKKKKNNIVVADFSQHYMQG